MSIFDDLLERLPTEEQTADYLKRLEQRTGWKAERLGEAAEGLAERAIGALTAIERRAEALERFTARVNAHVEGRRRPLTESDQTESDQTEPVGRR